MYNSCFCFTAGTAANAINYQAYLMEGLSRWNAARAEAAVQTKRQGSGGDAPRTFDVLLQHRCNQLAADTGLEPAFTAYRCPAEHTGKER